MASASAITVSLGILFLVSAEPALIRRGMGVFILLITVFIMFGFQYTGTHRSLIGFSTGAVAGGITGAFGVPAFPLSALYFHSSPSSADKIRANVLTALCCNLIIGIIGLSIQGVYNEPLILRAVIIAPVFMAGVYLGQFLFRIAPVAWFKNVTYGILIVSALVLIISA